MNKPRSEMTVEERLQALEKWTHEPFDFSDLIKRLEVLERGHPGLLGRNAKNKEESDYDMDRYSAR